jgi:hypothetical protein
MILERGSVGFIVDTLLIISSTRYKGRWVVEFGQSTQPDAPVRDGGCGPDPFDSTTVEFERSWEVVAAE